MAYYPASRQAPGVGYSSGQRGQTVNLLAYAYEGSNPSPTTTPQFGIPVFTLLFGQVSQKTPRLFKDVGCVPEGICFNPPQFSAVSRAQISAV